MAGASLVSDFSAEGDQRKSFGVTVQFDSGADPANAAALAKNSDVAIVFAYQWMSEDMDLPNLSLPDQQDALIEQVAAANPHTIVVLETGSAVTMPWINEWLALWKRGTRAAKVRTRLRAFYLAT